MIPLPRSQLLAVAALLCYVASFFLPTFEIAADGRSEASDGFAAFGVSFLALFQPLYGGLRVFATWLANPAFWYGAVQFARGRRGRAIVASGVALLLGCQPLFWPLILVGYYLWFVSMAMLMTASVAGILAWRRT
jgi:hypothetical protein